MKDLISFKNELQHIITGDGYTGQGNLIKATQAHLKADHYAGKKAENKQRTRAEEERALTRYITENNLWIKEVDLGTYITEGAEQKVFFFENTDYVVKLADAIFYLTWLDYFNNLLLHNAFFTNTPYGLLGFYNKNAKLFAVLKQPFVKITDTTNLENVKQFLFANGFKHTKNNDYNHPFLGIILEDLHDENVLTNNGILFFVDTVFYITEKFYK